MHANYVHQLRTGRMVEILNRKIDSELSNLHALLNDNEIVVIVDDSPDIAFLLSSFLKRQELPFELANCAAELYTLLETKTVALVLLDIGLPDEDGTEVLKKISTRFPDLGIIMVTGTTDIQTALECLREGADDYLTKPVSIHRFNRTIHEILRKRRMAIDNRIFQQELEATNFRTQFLHHLNLKMNSAYLSAVELNGVLQAILVGITSEDGLKFNRAFLALFDENHQTLKGRLAIGPARREDANRLWREIESKRIGLQQIIDDIIDGRVVKDIEINKIIERLAIPASATDHILIQACNMRKAILVQNGHSDICMVQNDLMELLSEQNFVIMPLYSPSRSLGVIIADNFVTGQPITSDDIHSLEIFASQASLAIEHSQLYREMQIKIDELQQATEELERSKDLLVKAERLSTLGHMSAQLVHSIRNPVTALGGTARLLAKKNQDPSTRQFLDIIIKEASKVEDTLEDLFSYVDDEKLHLQSCSLNTLVQQSVMAFYATMQKADIQWQFHLSEQNPTITVDIEKIKQVFHHLIKNSLEAMDGGGILSATTRIVDGKCQVIFGDSGQGVDNQLLQKASDAFFTTKTYGTGMGLTIVKQILSVHNAQFSFKSRQESGMEAIITFNS